MKKSLDWTTARRFKGDNQHFFVVGKPFHRTPLIQQTELKAGRFSFDTKPGVNTILSRRISEIAMAIRTKQALEREKEYEQQMEEAMQKHPMCAPPTIITEIEQQIQFAFALNLSSSQRLNRQGSGEIVHYVRAFIGFHTMRLFILPWTTQVATGRISRRARTRKH
jgi:hypothetical protein